MLVLTRKHDEAILIDGETVVRVLSVKHGRVKLGISAPDDVKVLRAEVVAEIPADGSFKVIDPVKVWNSAENNQQNSSMQLSR